MKMELKKKLQNIKLFVMDVDGILTNGEIVLDHNGNELKIFDVQDGYGIVLLRKTGIKTAIITARKSKAVELRAKDLGIDKVYQNASPKLDAFKKIIKAMNVKKSEVCYMGDDLPDLCVLTCVGVAITVPNAVKEVQQCVNYVTENEGGAGAVREVVEMILKAQSKWDSIVKAAMK